MNNKLDYIKTELQKAFYYENATRTLIYDQSTICPEGGLEEKNEMIAYLEHQAFLIRTGEEFVSRVRSLYEQRESLGEWDRAMIEQLYREDLIQKNIPKDRAHKFSYDEKESFTNWSKAKEKKDYSLFRDSLQTIYEDKKEACALREYTPEEKERIRGDYDALLDLFERGMDQATLDPLFEECKERLTSLMEKIRQSKKTIRTDFLSRKASLEAQTRVAEYLMELEGFDKNRGAMAFSEHPYTEYISKNDIRITTHLHEDNFLSNIYTILHETGHAIFDQRQPGENSDYFLIDGKTLGMHESVSRFYENIIGRSEPFIHLVYPKLKELLPEVLYDVSEEELYEAVNLVTPGLIRTEADEVTYTFHVIIRYELEKDLFSGKLTVDELPEAWDQKYEEYLGIRPKNAAEGVLQDVHWASDFGYFPTYSLGNFYNAMYYQRMQKELDVEKIVASGDLSPINDWMTEHVFKKADRLTPEEWLFDITGRKLTAEDFLTYLEEKYTKIYQL